MKIYKEIKKIAGMLAQIGHLINLLKQKGLDIDGIHWLEAQLVSGLSVKGEYLCEGDERIAQESGEHFVNQWTGYCEDDYYGYLYFKTDVPGQYVKVYYEC